MRRRSRIGAEHDALLVQNEVGYPPLEALPCRRIARQLS